MPTSVKLLCQHTTTGDIADVSQEIDCSTPCVFFHEKVFDTAIALSPLSMAEPLTIAGGARCTHHRQLLLPDQSAQ
jgi:hypothetical protein